MPTAVYVISNSPTLSLTAEVSDFDAVLRVQQLVTVDDGQVMHSTAVRLNQDQRQMLGEILLET